MKLTNQSARLYYIDGKPFPPNKTIEVGDEWKINPTLKAAIDKKELIIGDNKPANQPKDEKK